MLFRVRIEAPRVGRQYRLLPQLQSRIADPIRPIGPKIADAMRLRTGGVQDQFLKQAELLPQGGTKSWLQSQRARRTGTLTLVDTGAYRAAWLGRGSGSVIRVQKNGVAVGVNTGRFPQALVFQADRATTIRTARSAFSVEPRRINVNPAMVRQAKAAILDYIVRPSR